jgi:hypothetical protein
VSVSPARQAVGERRHARAVGCGQGSAVGAFHERGDGGGALLHAERRLGELRGAGGLGGLREELRGVVGDDAVAELRADAGERDGRDQPQQDDALGVGGDVGDDALKHLGPP